MNNEMELIFKVLGIIIPLIGALVGAIWSMLNGKIEAVNKELDLQRRNIAKLFDQDGDLLREIYKK